MPNPELWQNAAKSSVAILVTLVLLPYIDGCKTVGNLAERLREIFLAQHEVVASANHPSGINPHNTETKLFLYSPHELYIPRFPGFQETRRA